MPLQEELEPKILIDSDADPFVPKGWKVYKHHRGGIIKWFPDKGKIYTPDERKYGGGLRFSDLEKELKQNRVLNANVLDAVLKDPQLIPPEWWCAFGANGDTAISFLGTIYLAGNGDQVVRCLKYGLADWYEDYFRVNHYWLRYQKVAIL